MGKVAGAKHGFNEGSSIKSMAGLSGGDGEKAERIGVEAVELAFIAEALDDGLGTDEGLMSVLVRQLRH